MKGEKSEEQETYGIGNPLFALCWPAVVGLLL